MSQHHFFIKNDEQKTHILMGWDRPLQGYFLVINKENDTDEAYWSNLDAAISHPKTLEPFLAALASLGITLPPAMIIAIEEDAEQNRGNRQVIHQVQHEYRCFEGIHPGHEPLRMAFSTYETVS